MKKWFKGIRGRLLFAACMPVIALSCVIGVSLNTSSKLGHLLNDSFGRIVPNLNSIGDIRDGRGNMLYY